MASYTLCGNFVPLCEPTSVVFTSAVQKLSQQRVLIFFELMNIVQSCNLVERQHIGELHMSREPCEKNSDQIERGLCDCGAHKVHSIML